jgi:hypothetical protein
VTGYVFCVYEETKAVIGDVFALPSAPSPADWPPLRPGPPRRAEIEETLLRHLFETLLNSPQSTASSRSFCCTLRAACRRFFLRRASGLPPLFMVQQLRGLWNRARA